jgi:hypothetical protein
VNAGREFERVEVRREARRSGLIRPFIDGLLVGSSLWFLVVLLTLPGCWVQSRRDQYLRDHPGNPYAEQIHNGYLAVGETEDDVLAAWGTELRCSVVESTRGAMWKYCGLSDGSSIDLCLLRPERARLGHNNRDQLAFD